MAVFDRSARALSGATLCLLAAFLLLAACSSSDGDAVSADTAATAEPTPVAPTAAPEPEPTPTMPPTPTATPEPQGAAPAARALDAVVALLNNPTATAADVESIFAPLFLAEVPVAQVIAISTQLAATATSPWELVESDVDLDDPAAVEAVAIIRADGTDDFEVSVAAEPDAPHLIIGLFLRPLPDASGSFADFEAALAEVGTMQRIGIYEIDAAGGCSALYEQNADQVVAIGSIFKLWILEELANQIQSGEAAWDEILPVDDRYKANPAGQVFDLPAGTEMTLQRYAELMISESDNSATDHLLFRLGRERVEATMATRVANPTLNIPFFGAAELFRIKFDPMEPNSQTYRDMDLATRRATLDQMIDEVSPWSDQADFPVENGDGVALDQPRDHDLEWFASPREVCGTLTALAALAEQPGLAPIGDIMRTNASAGMPFEGQDWTDLRFKGGSEQGLIAVGWWMRDASDHTFVVAAQVEDPETALDPLSVLGLLHQAGRFAPDLAG